MAQLVAASRLAREQHRHSVAISGLELGVCIDVDDGERRAGGRCERFERSEHLIAEVTVGAGEQGKVHAL